MLTSNKVRGIEQAALVLGTLDHKPAAPRLVELLEHPKSRVFITAAWALRKVAVPETAAAILAKIERETTASIALQAQFDEYAAKQIQLPDYSRMPLIYDQLAHLIEALGVLNYRAALPTFKRYFPKPPLVGVTDPPPVSTLRQYALRAAIVDALGRMYADDAPEDLVAYFVDRLSDENPSHPESTQMRVNAAVALARMDAKEHIETIDRFFLPDRGYTQLTDACAWALVKLAGREPYHAQPVMVRQFGWFLEPIDE
jgi:HEAT repeat protein